MNTPGNGSEGSGIELEGDGGYHLEGGLPGLVQRGGDTYEALYPTEERAGCNTDFPEQTTVQRGVGAVYTDNPEA